MLSLAVAQGLDELPDQQRQVLVLRFFADLPVRSIAQELGVPEGTVKSSTAHGGTGHARPTARGRGGVT